MIRDSHNLAKKTFWSTMWTVADLFATRFTAFIVGIVLARLLTPSDYGLVGMLTVFITLSNCFVEAGFGNALIRKLDRNDTDLSVAFFFNVAVGIVAYLILVLISPLVAQFYSQDILSELLKVVGLNVILQSLCIVPNAILVANFDIKKQAKANFLGSLLSGIIAIVMAYHGWGVWALVWQTLISTFLKMLFIWLQVRWIPVLKYSASSLHYLWGFGSKSLAVQLMGSFFNELYSIVIGKVYTQTALGVFSRGDQIVRLLPNTLSSVFTRVCIATFSNLQDDKEKLLSVYRKYMNVVSFFIFASMTLLLIDSRPLVIALLTKKWEDTILIIQILCIGIAFSPFSSINLMLLQAINQVKYSMKLEIRKKILFVAMLAITIPLGLIPMVIGSSIYNFVATMMNLSCSRKFIGYQYNVQFRDMGLYILLSVIAGVIGYCSTIYIENEWLCLVIRTLIFITVYAILAFLLKVKAIEDIKALRTKIH